MYAELERKVRSGERLSDEDVMRFIVMPLTAADGKQEMIERTVSLAKEIGSEEEQSFIIAGLLCATDKFIDREYSNRLKEWLKMTKVARLYEEEKIEYANEYANEKLNERTLKIARTLLEKNVDILTIMESTGLNKAKILKLTDDYIETE